MTRGRLITIEGLDGAGKTTLAASLVTALRERGLDAEVLREPGGVVVAERLRELLASPASEVHPRTEALLFAAARAQLVAERLRPWLTRGRWVVLDRYVDSSLAYQGAARGLGTAEVAAVNAFATGGLVPDRTLLLLLDPAVGRARQEGRGAADRLEREDEDFFRAVDGAYRDLATAEPHRIATLDATLSPVEVLAAALAALHDLLPGSGNGHHDPRPGDDAL